MKIKIFQIFYREAHIETLDDGFLPYDNSGKDFPFNFEYAVLFDLYNQINWNDTDFVGTVSWKFRQKTGLSSDAIKKHISAKPGNDVYFINPFPELCIYKSVWEQGDRFHKDLTKYAQELLSNAGYDNDIVRMETPPYLTAYCNYWVANKSFWDAYIAFLTPLWKYVQNPVANENGIIGKPADRLTGSPYLPFIFERLFSSFLASHKFRVSSLPIYTSKHSRYPILSPLFFRISQLSQAKSLKDVPFIDKIIITCFHHIKKFLNFRLRYIINKARMVRNLRR